MFEHPQHGDGRQAANDETWTPPDLRTFGWLQVSSHPAVPHGKVALVDPQLAADATSLLHPAERALAESMPTAKRNTFVAGRVALRAAVERANAAFATTALLRDARGAPLMPAGLLGSISHKHSMAAAVVASAGANASRTIGIDVEERSHMRRKLRDIAPRILVDNEIGLVQDFSESDRHEAVVLLFAMKEAIYKAIDPYVRRHVRFQEVEIRTEHSLNREIGHADVVMHLPEFGIVRPSVSVHWWKSDRHLFAIAESR